MNNSMNLSFQLKTAKKDENGQAPIYARITINGVSGKSTQIDPSRHFKLTPVGHFKLTPCIRDREQLFLYDRIGCFKQNKPR